MWIFLFLTWFVLIVDEQRCNGAVMPPPWANPKINPCAIHPKGWQLLYWPPDGKCYKIFQIGYPCPDDMELSPAATNFKEQKYLAECRCPPKTAQSIKDNRCYELFTKGPCEIGEYFAPDRNNSSSLKWGKCKQLTKCPKKNEIFWPQDGRCHQKLTKGPCSKGQLLTTNTNQIPICKCDKNRELKDYYYQDGCYQHFTKGPCKVKGLLFLPDLTCGCHKFLPHFHYETEQCFEIGTIGPCNSGEIYQLDNERRRGICECKTGYIRYLNTTSCYRPFTQGPCHIDHILINETLCIKQPCERGYLYFPENGKCHRIGTRGPCPKGRIVTFDFETRPSVDGISYNGVCTCNGNNCSNDKEEEEEECNRNDGLIIYDNRCYKLYSQGPCPKGAWIAPKRHKKTEDFYWNEKNKKDGICECMPGYIKTIETINGNFTRMDCVSPTVILADYLNKNFSKIKT